MDACDDPPVPSGVNPIASRSILLGMIGLLIGGAFVYLLLRPRSTPPPSAVASDPLLVAGREVYNIRCIGCHGEAGRGDGPSGKGLTGPPPGNFAADRWKHGDGPEAALGVVSKGVSGTGMAAWARYLAPEEVRAATAYCYYLGGRPVPQSLR